MGDHEVCIRSFASDAPSTGKRGRETGLKVGKPVCKALVSPAKGGKMVTYKVTEIDPKRIPSSRLSVSDRGPNPAKYLISDSFALVPLMLAMIGLKKLCVFDNGLQDLQSTLMHT